MRQEKNSMKLFVVDREECSRDGICVSACPMGIIELKEQNSTPTPTSNAERLCINCGYCVAACPLGLLHHRYRGKAIYKSTEPN